MTAVYWSIPLLVMAVAIAVAPVLYGTLRDQRWEEAHAPQSAAAAVLTQTAPAPGVAEVPGVVTHSFELVHDEVMALLARLEQLRELAVSEFREAAAEDPLSA